ncbi:MAG: gluconate 2-dehydrogenase subunit 3 family protein [Deltaproteobacteria bacterium]|nr:gluconate 2-dehydrogenase subunit 3 family protein [Deltaproteobacteria bacterium]
MRYTAVSGGLLALSRLRVAPVLAAESAESHAGLQVLTAHEATIFTAIVERMVASDDPAMPKVRDTPAVETIDQALLQLDADQQYQLKWLLRIFQWAPPLLMLRLSTFTGLAASEQDEYIRGWATSPRDLRRLAFRALKNLSMLGYYSQDATWPALHYPGPWVPRPRRVVSGGL